MTFNISMSLHTTKIRLLNGNMNGYNKDIGTQRHTYNLPRTSKNLATSLKVKCPKWVDTKEERN